MKSTIDMMLDGIEWKATGVVDPGDGTLFATHEGTLTIGSDILMVYVLNDGRRVISEDSLIKFFGGEE
jgi:hypothetical protein